MDLITTFADLGIALGLGLLVSPQREQVTTQLAGLVTFAPITDRSLSKELSVIAGLSTPELPAVPLMILFFLGPPWRLRLK